MNCGGGGFLYFYFFWSIFLWYRGSFFPTLLNLWAISRWLSRHDCRIVLTHPVQKKLKIVRSGMGREALVVHLFLVLSTLLLCIMLATFQLAGFCRVKNGLDNDWNFLKKSYFICWQQYGCFVRQILSMISCNLI